MSEKCFTRDNEIHVFKPLLLNKYEHKFSKNLWKSSQNHSKRSSFHADYYSSRPRDRFLEAEQRFACMEAETVGNFRQKFRKFLRTFENFRKILGKIRNVSKKSETFEEF